MPELPDLTDDIRRAWNTTAPEAQWIVEIDPDLAHVVVVDDTDRSFARIPVGIGEGITFGDPVKVRPGYIDHAEPVAASTVFASRAESRPAVAASEPPAEPVPPAHAPTEPVAAPETAPTPPEPPAPELPAAEPEPVNTDPKEDPVSTDLSAFRSRLGLPDDADHNAVLEAFAAKLTEAEAKTPEPTPEMVAASAAAAKAAEAALADAAKADAARLEMKTEIDRLSGELATIKASAANDVKNTLFTGAVKDGKIKPADRESWEGRYDKAPEVITEILASIAPGTAVPVMASGVVGDPEPTGGDTGFEADYERHFGADPKVGA